MYGSEVNLASKLGEDLAQRGEILLTEAAHERVKKGVHEYEPLQLSISGLQLAAYRVKKGTVL
jgi:class 3 adenylate cyclase